LDFTETFAIIPSKEVLYMVAKFPAANYFSSLKLNPSLNRIDLFLSIIIKNNY